MLASDLPATACYCLHPGVLLTYLLLSATACTQVCFGSDAYSFGVLMWTLYTGMQPFVYNNANVLMKNPLFPHFPPSAHPEYTSLTRWCLRRDPHERPSFVEIARCLCELFKISEEPDDH